MRATIRGSLTTSAYQAAATLTIEQAPRLLQADDE
jgi:hypothetical protein